MDICGNCFSEYSAETTCPKCGFNNLEQQERYPLALHAGSILNGRYIVGRVLGQGGFGITYKAWDDLNKEQVAIKEFMPTENVVRSQDSVSVQAISYNHREYFEFGKEQFLDEAKRLASLKGDDHIVRVYSYFEENNTSYFVMEYVDGSSMSGYLAKNGGKISLEEANRLLIPMMESLERVHSKGMIHRDIAPDNILITKEGKTKLIDFGAARFSTGEKSKTMDKIYKPGFAPKEQYMQRGRQGPFTDVYAMAATYYKVITGRTPPPAVERMDEDELLAPNVLGVRMPGNTEEVLLKALEVDYRDRYQTMGEFRMALLGENAGEDRETHFKDMWEQGTSAYQAKDYLEAIKYYSEALSVKDDAVVYYNLGAAYKHLGQANKAREAFESALRLNPDDTDTLFNLGILALDGNNNSQALNYLKKAYDQMPMGYSYRGGLTANYALAVARNGDKKEGLRLLDTARKLFRYENYAEMKAKIEAIGEPEAKESNDERYKRLFSQGNKAIKAKNYESAIKYYTEALTIKQDADIYYNMGLSYHNLGQIGKAREAYESALRLNPDDTDTLFNLGLLALDGNNNSQALNYLKKAYDHVPVGYSRRGGLTANYAVAVARNGDKKEGLRLLDVAKSFGYERYAERKAEIDALGEPEPKESNEERYKRLYNQGDKEFNAENYSLAIAYYNDALSIKKNAMVYISIGLAHKKLGQFKEARENYEKALSLEPNNLDALNNIGVLELDENNVALGLHYLKRLYDRIPLGNSQRGLYTANYALAVARNGDKKEGLRLLDVAKSFGYAKYAERKAEIEALPEKNTSTEQQNIKTEDTGIIDKLIKKYKNLPKKKKIIVNFLLVCAIVFARQVSQEETSRPVTTSRPVATSSPAKTTKPVSTTKPANTTKPAATPKPTDASVALSGYWSSEKAYLRHGASSSFFKLTNDVKNCTGLTLNIKVTDYSGYPFDEWYLYARDLNGEWDHIAMFTLEETLTLNKNLKFPLTFDAPESFDALAICHVADGYAYSISYDLYYTDVKTR